MKIKILKKEKYTIQQLEELNNALANDKYTKDDYLSELNMLQKEGLIEIHDTTVKELEEILRIDVQEQLNSNKDI